MKLEIVYRDHSITAQAQSVSERGAGWWSMQIEEPGGRPVYLDMEVVLSLEQVGKFLSDLCDRVDAMERHNSERDQ